MLNTLKDTVSTVASPFLSVSSFLKYLIDPLYFLQVQYGVNYLEYI